MASFTVPSTIYEDVIEAGGDARSLIENWKIKYPFSNFKGYLATKGAMEGKHVIFLSDEPRDQSTDDILESLGLA